MLRRVSVEKTTGRADIARALEKARRLGEGKRMELLRVLAEGNGRFRQAVFPGLPEELKKGQRPHTVMLTCSNAKMSPNRIFNAQLGEVFGLHAAGLSADRTLLGSAEYAAEHLGSRFLLAVGHYDCKAVERVRRGEELRRAAEKNAREQLRSMLAQSEVLRKKVKTGVAMYDDATGEVHFIDAKNAPQELVRRLLDGNREFLRKLGAGELQVEKNPHTVLVTCSDSRVSDIVFDQPLGAVATLKVAGNVFSPTLLASVEHSVRKNGARLLVVMGHTGCGAVKETHRALEEGKTPDPGTPIGSLVEAIKPAVDAASMDNSIKNNARHQLERYLSASPFLRQMVGEGRLQVATALYNLDNGEVRFYDAKTGEPLVL
ncbi:MAG: carbonic anhydrase [Candidatus Micrarchaeia archaeon]